MGTAQMERRIDTRQMRFKDVLSLLHFIPTTDKIKELTLLQKEHEEKIDLLTKNLEESEKA